MQIKNTENSWKMPQIKTTGLKGLEDTPATIKKQNLSTMVKRVENMDSLQYSGKSWNKLMKAYAKAKKVTMSEEPSQKELDKAIRELMAALNALEAAEKEVKDELREPLPLVLNQNSGQSAAAAAASITANSGGGDGVDVSA